jgi:hypothetical protein
MGKFERSGMGRERGLAWALGDIFTMANFEIAKDLSKFFVIGSDSVGLWERQKLPFHSSLIGARKAGTQLHRAPTWANP